MNTLKTVVIIVLLAAVAYGVYVSLTRSPRESSNSDSAVAPVWAPQNHTPGSSGPLVQLPGGAGGSPAGNQPSMGGPFSGLGSFPFASGTGVGSAPGGPRRSSAAGAAQQPPNALGLQSGASPSAGLTSSAPNGIAAPPAAETPTDGLGVPQPRGPVVLGPPPNRAAGGDAVQPPPGFPAISGTAEPVDRRNDGSRLGTGQTAASPGDEQLDPEVLQKFQLFLQPVQRMIESGQLDDALVALSRIYDNPALPPALARQLTPMLDSLAATVIYSRQHLLEPPYRVQPGDTPERIAQQYNVPWQLLARINGIEDSQQLVPGQTLKVVRGPFSAVVNLDRYELTLKLGERYAGRFPIGIGRDSPRLEGTYAVRDKLVNPVYYGPDGFRANGGHSDNPLGRFLLDLGDQVGIHGTNDVRWVGRDDGRGAICLGDRDIDDVFGILSIGSRVVIQR